jgi:hypothetical protein
MAQTAIKAQPAYFQGEEYMLVVNDTNEKTINEKQVKEQIQPDGDKIRTEKEVKQSPKGKEIHTKTIEVEDSSVNSNSNNIGLKNHVDFSWLLWAAILGSVIFFVWRAGRRDRADR